MADAKLQQMRGITKYNAGLSLTQEQAYADENSLFAILCAVSFFSGKWQGAVHSYHRSLKTSAVIDSKKLD